MIKLVIYYIDKVYRLFNMDPSTCLSTGIHYLRIWTLWRSWLSD